MNRKHLLWYVFEFLESKDMIEELKKYCEGRTFNDDSLIGEITVKAAIKERHKAYIDSKRKQND